MTFVINGTTGATQSASFDSASTFGFKNRIINGAMMIDQRNAGASVTPTSGNYTLDRFQYSATQASKFSVQQTSTAPQGFNNSLKLTVASAVASPASGDYFLLQQVIEGYNFQDLNWGSANAQAATLSFWVYSSVTGTFGVTIRSGDTTQCFPSSYTVSAANTWQRVTIPITAPTTGGTTAFPITTSGACAVWFGLGYGSSYTGNLTQNTWSAGFCGQPSGATNLVSTGSATFYITGVQLEKGGTATSFDYRPYGTELALCQRYFQTGSRYCGGLNGTTLWNSMLPVPVALRATPSISYTGTGIVTAWGVGTWNTTTQPSGIGLNGVNLAFNITGFTASQAFGMGEFSATLAISAEL